MGFIVVVEHEAVVVLGVVVDAGWSRGRLDVCYEIVVACLEVVLGVRLTRIFDDLGDQIREKGIDGYE